ncbi:Germin family 1 protein [Quillaja saponaria]|uniref:Germin-like protein n=1 Tax=Quillaja saponaria TaxID=32244 RepID=A0AAD7LFI1_QUISA|nr:Germin family 1 protein [Quillaja saponaria]
MDSISLLCIVLLLVACTCIKLSLADSDNVQDACPTAPLGKQTIFINGFPCKNPANISASDFKTTKLSNAGDIDNILGSSVNIVTAADFPGLNTLGLSVGRIDLEVDGVVSTHSHPRASELFFVNKGIVLAGFLDSQNQLFQKVLKEGDVFVFPRGLLHFCLNGGFEVATAFSVFSSQNPGQVAIFSTFFDLTVEASEKQKRRLISLSASEVYQITNATLTGFESF